MVVRQLLAPEIQVHLRALEACVYRFYIALGYFIAYFISPKSSLVGGSLLSVHRQQRSCTAGTNEGLPRAWVALRATLHFLFT